MKLCQYFCFQADLEAKSADLVKIAGTLQAKEGEIHNHEELLNQAKGKCQQLEEDYTKLEEKTAADYVRLEIFA